MFPRYVVIETYTEGSKVEMQVLNKHQTVTSAFWYYPTHATQQLRLIDLQRETVHTWDECQSLMVTEQLKRVQAEKRVESHILTALTAMGYLNMDCTISTKGYEMLAQYDKKPLIITIAHIQSDNKVHL